MKNLIQKTNALSLIFNTTQGQRNGKLSEEFVSNDKQALVNLFIQVTALMLSLPVITALLMVWFKMK